MEELRHGSVILLKDGRKAVARYAGKTHFSEGDWVGIELEEPDGKNDGSVAGERYFECEQDYGLFIKRGAVAQILERPAKAQPASRARSQTGAAAGDKRPGASTMQSRHSVNTGSLSSGSRAASQQRPGLRVCWLDLKPIVLTSPLIIIPFSIAVSYQVAYETNDDSFCFSFIHWRHFTTTSYETQISNVEHYEYKVLHGPSTASFGNPLITTIII